VSDPVHFGGPYPVERLMASPDRVFPDTRQNDGRGFGLGDDAMAMRALALRDPLYMASKVLVAPGQWSPFANPAPEHRKVADLIKGYRSYMFLHHRGSFKTTLSDEVGSIYSLLDNPNNRILFMQASLENGKALSRQVRQHFRETPTLRAIFPEYRIDTADEAGQVLAWSVPCRTVNKREASLEIGTPDANLSGRHYDILAGSDISNEQTSPPPCGRGTIEEAIKLRNWLATTDGLRESHVVNPKACTRIDGTRWGEMDIYAYILENDPRNIYEKVIAGVTCEDGIFRSSIPGFTHEYLAEIRSRPTMSAALWAANYMNSPIIGDGAMQFRPEWFHDYQQAPELLDVAITVDPAWTEQDKNPDADRSAIIVSGVAPDGNLYVLAIRAGRWSPSKLLDTIYSLVATWDPSWVGIEGGTQSVALLETFQNEMQRSFPSIPTRVLKPKGQNKLVRALSLHNHAEKRGIYVKRAEHDELVQELLKFPGGRYKDLVDALAYRAQDLYVPHLRSALATEIRPENPRGLMTGQDVLNVLAGRAQGNRLTPWDKMLTGRN